MTLTCQRRECHKDLNECKFLDLAHFCKFFQPSINVKTMSHQDI